MTIRFSLCLIVKSYCSSEQLEMWVKEDYDGAKAIWASAATDLSQASYGTELVRTIGKVSTDALCNCFI